MTNSINYLEWDSDFFGYKVGQLISHSFTTKNELCEIVELAKKENYRLLYFKSKDVEPLLSLSYNITQILLIDKKATFKKSIEKQNNFTFDPLLQIYSGKDLNDKLLDITLQSGVFSRFHLDPNFTNQEFEKLYTEWIKKSLTGEIAKEVWVNLNDKNEINGLITLGKKNNAADIGLLAVDKETRGLNIGSKLIELAKFRASEWGETKLQVVTQLDNQPAFKFYKNRGFEIIEIEYIYHLWI